MFCIRQVCKGSIALEHIEHIALFEAGARKPFTITGRINCG